MSGDATAGAHAAARMLDSRTCPSPPTTSGSSGSWTPPPAKASPSTSGSSTSRPTPPRKPRPPLGAEIGQIVKSLVFVAPDDDSGLEPILCLVAGHNRVDLARLAAVTGARDVRRATAREANELTGFSIGGIPPIGHQRPVRVFMDPDLGRFQVVWAAAGIPTAVFPVPPATLRTLANATVAPMTEERRAADVEAERDAASGPGGFTGDGRAAASNAGA